MGPIALEKYRLAKKKQSLSKTRFMDSFTSLFSNVNLQGIYLHLFADTMGSVSVIISSILIHFYGIHIADPICSCLVACLVFWTSLPLIKRSTGLLLQRIPLQMDEALKDCVEDILKIKGVVGVRKVHFWHVPITVVASLQVRIDAEAAADRGRVMRDIQAVMRRFLRPEMTNLTIQLEGPNSWGFLGDTKMEGGINISSNNNRLIALPVNVAARAPPPLPPPPPRRVINGVEGPEEVIEFGTVRIS